MVAFVAEGQDGIGSDDLDVVMAEVRTKFQPVCDLGSGRPVGFEALCRGEPGSRFELPAALFGAAHVHDRVSELDWRCQSSAVSSALDAGLAAPWMLFVNAEPETAKDRLPSHLDQLMRRGARHFKLVLEVTERALGTNLTGLLGTFRRARRAGILVALDDVGVEPDSLALMPLLDPDIVKLDLSLVQATDRRSVADTLNAVVAHTERTGATILAEGIETEEQRQRSIAIGATLGQGWLFGRPAPLPRPLPEPGPLSVTQRSPFVPPGETPFEVGAAARPVLRSSKRHLLEISHHLESHIERTFEPPVLLVGLQHARNFPAASSARYDDLARRCSFVAIMGSDLDPASVPGMNGIRLEPKDQLTNEWIVIVIGPHFSGALLAQDLGDSGPDKDRTFDYVLTYDRHLVVAAARTLLSRL